MGTLRTPFTDPILVEPTYSNLSGSPAALSLDDYSNKDAFFTDNLTGNLEISVSNLRNGVDGYPEGSKIRVKVTDDGNGRTVSFGTNVTGTSITLATSGVYIITLEKANGHYYAVSKEQVA